MERDTGRSRQVSELRKRAEKKVKQQIVKLQSRPSMNSAQLIQELQVHQIELEMQNEELRRVQLELEESRSKYFSLFDLAPVGYFTLDERELIREVNLAGAELLGTDRRYLIKRKFSHFITRESQDVFYLHCKEALRTKKKQTCELRLRRKDSSDFYAGLLGISCQDPEGNFSDLRIAVTDMTERENAKQKMLEYQSQLKSLASQLTMVEEHERRHLAELLHDQVGQLLVVSKLKLDVLCNNISSDKARKVLQEDSALLGQVIKNIRSLTFDLSSPILYELGIEAAVEEWLREQVQEKHGICTCFEDNGQTRFLDEDIRALLFRNVKELLINVIKHAHARNVKVSICKSDSQVEVTVEDDGVGFDPVETMSMVARKGKFGHLSVRERLEKLGGHFVIDSAPSHGCRAIMTVPVKNEKIWCGEENERENFNSR